MKIDIKRSIKGTIIGTIILNALIFLLFGCGSMRMSSINERDDVSLNEQASYSEQRITRNEATTDLFESQVEAQKNAYKTLTEDAKAANADQKYPGIIGTAYTLYTIRYEVYLGNVLVGSWVVSPKTMPSRKYLPIGKYTVKGYEQRRNQWILRSSWTIEVTNMAVYDDTFHFSLLAFQ